MADVSRLAGGINAQDGFVVETEAGGDSYRYVLRRDGTEEDTVVLTARFKNGERVQEKLTETVEDAMAERGYEVELA